MMAGVDPADQRDDEGEQGGQRHPPRRRARMVKASMKGSPDQGSRITEIRPAYCKKYGASM